MIRKIILSIVIFFMICLPVFAVNKFYWATGLTGGGAALDGIDGAGLSAGDAAIVILDSGTNVPLVYFYRLQASSAAESSPNVIRPDANAGTSSWHLSGVVSTTVDIGAAVDTTLGRSAAGVMSVEGVTSPRVIASGATSLDFGSTATGACATVIQATATGAASTDVIIFNANASIKAVTGYVPASTGGFSISAFPTSGYVNFEACNWTAGTVDPGAITVNWAVVR